MNKKILEKIFKKSDKHLRFSFEIKIYQKKIIKLICFLFYQVRQDI